MINVCQKLTLNVCRFEREVLSGEGVEGGGEDQLVLAFLRHEGEQAEQLQARVLEESLLRPLSRILKVSLMFQELILLRSKLFFS